MRPRGRKPTQSTACGWARRVASCARQPLEGGDPLGDDGAEYTDRLRLEPLSPAHVLALFESEQAFERAFGLPAAEGLRAFFLSDDVSPDWVAALRAAPPGPDPWVWGFAVIDTDAHAVVGSVGFKGPPDADGLVEIAYGIVPGFQGRGMATEAARAAIAFACANGARRLRAHTRPATNASTRVLEKCGFAFAGDVDDPADGPVWRWERRGGDRG